jgi:hypothetical protein
MVKRGDYYGPEPRPSLRAMTPGVGADPAEMILV